MAHILEHSFVENLFALLIEVLHIIQLHKYRNSSSINFKRVNQVGISISTREIELVGRFPQIRIGVEIC